MGYSSNNIKNILILGHQGSGKTTLTESLVAWVKKSKKGTVEQKNTISDFTKEEQARLSSCQLAIVPVEYKGFKINFIDCPGNADFINEGISCLPIVNGGILVIDAASGVQPETIKHFRMLKKAGVPTIIFINKMDKENIKYDEVLDDIKAKLDKQLPVSFCYPHGQDVSFDGFLNSVTMKSSILSGDKVEVSDIPADKLEKAKELRSAIEEKVAVTDDALLEKFFGGEGLSDEEISKALHTAVSTCEVMPILCGCVAKNIGLDTILDSVLNYTLSNEELKPFAGSEEKYGSRKCSEAEPFSAFCFKTYFDPFKGVINLVKVLSGTLHQGDEVYNPRVNETQKVSSMLSLSGITQTPVDTAVAGDIVGLVKFEDLSINDTICDKNKVFEAKKIDFPNAVFFKAVTFKDTKDEEKSTTAFNKLQLENPCLEIKRNPETKQLLLGGVSESFLAFIKERTKNLFNVELTYVEPKIVYRETIRATGSAEGRYVKQSGGSGMYGVVVMQFEPTEESVFEERIFGGSVPKNYIPAVEKGFYEGLNAGQLAGFPVLGVKGILLDGKYHPVDSNDFSFKMAAQLAFKEAYQKCKPTILEPIMKIEITVDGEYVGNILNDLNQRRARVQEILEIGEGMQKVIALVPEAEIQDYVSKLRVLTKGSGSFNRTFESYEEAPSNLVPQIIAKNSLLKKEEK